MAVDLYVAWQDEVTRSWHTIARLKRLGHAYELAFTKGAEQLDEVTKTIFRLEPGDRYLFDELIPFFKNKIPPKNRPDFPRMASWLGVSRSSDEFALLSVFGLMPTADSTLVYPAPNAHDGKYKVKFFVHGIRHRSEEAVRLSGILIEGTRLLPMLDVHNKVDPDAVALRVEDTDILIGYVPAFYANDIKRLLIDAASVSTASLTVSRNNRDSPIQLRLLCEFTALAPENFQALDTDSHKIIVGRTITSQSFQTANMPLNG